MKLFTTKLLFVFFHCNVVNTQLVMPSPDAFLQTIFNTNTANEVVKLVNNFIFHDVRPQDIRFLLYHKNGFNQTFDLNSNASEVSLNNTTPIKFIIHGWQGSGEDDFTQSVSKAYHSVGIDMIFGVDWSEHAQKEYMHAAESVKDIGKLLAKFISKITGNSPDLMKNVHLVGHSLGAQIAGFAGKEFNASKGVRLGRITGLDAAGPLFEFPVKRPHKQRLTKRDAAFVDAIHTNAGFFGFIEPFATVDYYINFGGPLQPDCLDANIIEAFVCSHSMSYKIFMRTITKKDLIATACDNSVLFATNLCSWNEQVIMGEHNTRKNASGSYYINIEATETTNNKSE